MAIARGYAATDASQPLTAFAFERRDTGDEDVVITIQYCGVCHTDIHLVENAWGNAIETGSGLPTYGSCSDHFMIKENYVLSFPDALSPDAIAATPL